MPTPLIDCPDPYHGVYRDEHRRCLCDWCKDRRAAVAARKRAERAAGREAAGFPPTGPQPSSVPVIRELMNRGWKRTAIAKALDMHPDSLRPNREQGTATRCAVELDRLLAVKLPTDVTRPDWFDDAACKGRTDLFFPAEDANKGGSLDDSKRRRDARAMCQSCPVRVECRATAVVWNETGIWGGELFRHGMKGLA
jgi:hypothetical protein